jgi:hypothetical protein
VLRVLLMSADNRAIPIAYEMQPIGPFNGFEAIGAFAFCSADCRTAFVWSHPDLVLHQADEVADLFADNHQCDYCGKEVYA